MEQTEEMQRIQITEEQARQKVELRDKWLELLKNPLFEELVTKQYLHDDAARLTMQFSPETDKNGRVTSMLQAKALFSRYVGLVIEEGNMSEQSLDEHAALREELVAEA